jgi:hypothetical protein
MAVAIVGAACSSTPTTRLTQFGECDGEFPSPVEYQALFAGHLDRPPYTTELLVISRQADLDAFAAATANGPVIPGSEAWQVDFSSHVVIAASVFVASSCGMTLDSYSVGQVGETVRLGVHATDHSGTCDAVCDAQGQLWTVVAVTRAQRISACIERTDVCD